ncbi:MAG: GTP-binding protein, partial [Cyanobacteria bacterium P01_A01_bin.84]
VVVGGYIGCGKTSWIYQQIALKEKAVPRYYRKILYFKAGSGQFQIDQKRIRVDFPKLKTFCDGQEAEFINEIESADVAYIELGNNLGLGYIEELLNDLPYYPVAILPPMLRRCKWHSWGKEVLTGAAMKTFISSETNSETNLEIETLRIETTGKIISGKNFNEFWHQITSQTYGKIIRSKGIFHLEDDNIIYADFINGVPCIDFLDLNLLTYLHCYPKCFSGLEIVGFSLNELALHKVIQSIYTVRAKVLKSSS